MDAVYPAAGSALARGRRLRRAEPRVRHRTMPVTFAEIKEVDEENEEAQVYEERRRKHDVMEERLNRQFTEFRRRRAQRGALREREHESPPRAAVPSETSTSSTASANSTTSTSSAPLARAGSEPAALNRRDASDT